MSTPHKRKRKGFTIVELLMALTIMAVLMVTLGIAFEASVKNFHDNEDIYKMTNTARQALLRITNNLRTAQAIALIGSGDPDNSQCSIILSDGSDITYKFDNTDNTLYYVTNDDLTDSDYVLCKNVTAMTFNRSTVPDNPSAIRSVRIVITVSDDEGRATQTLAAGTVIRKNL